MKAIPTMYMLYMYTTIFQWFAVKGYGPFLHSAVIRLTAILENAL